MWGDAGGLAAIVPGTTVQVWGLPGAPGTLIATRVEQRAPSAPIVTGRIQNLSARTFTLGGITVEYGLAAPSGIVDCQPLANGRIVRVRGNAATASSVLASAIQSWYPVPTADGTPVQMSGPVTDFGGLGAMRVLGVPVHASSAAVTGGPASSVSAGVRVDVAGAMSGGVLVASMLKIRHVPGTGGPSSFEVTGTIGAFSAGASAHVRHLPLDELVWLALPPAHRPSEDRVCEDFGATGVVAREVTEDEIVANVGMPKRWPERRRLAELESDDDSSNDDDEEEDRGVDAASADEEDERRLLNEELSMDQDAYARSNEDGWFYD